MGRLTPVSSFKSSYNGLQFGWAAGKGAILSKVTQFLCFVLLFQPLSAHQGSEQKLSSYLQSSCTQIDLLTHIGPCKVNYGESGRPCGNVTSVWVVCGSCTLWALWTTHILEVCLWCVCVRTFVHVYLCVGPCVQCTHNAVCPFVVCVSSLCVCMCFATGEYKGQCVEGNTGWDFILYLGILINLLILPSVHFKWLWYSKKAEA